MTDAELAARAARGDETAFRILYERHKRAVYGYAWVCTGRVEDAEDVTQECFLVLLRDPAAYDPARGQMRTWLYGVTRKLSLRRVRALAREEPLDEDNDIEIDSRLEATEAVRQAIALLPVAQREAVFLFEVEGLTLAETAEVLGIEANAVKARLHRARQQLKRMFSQLENV